MLRPCPGVRATLLAAAIAPLPPFKPRHLTGLGAPLVGTDG